MPGFTYNTRGATNVNRFRHYINLGGSGRQAKSGSFTMPTSNGLHSVTGVGFKPDALLIYGIFLPITETDNFDGYSVFHLGVATSPSSQWGGGIFGVYLGSLGSAEPWNWGDWNSENILAGVWAGYHSGSGYAPTTGGTHYNVRGKLVSFDNDGFTLNITQHGGSAFKVFYLALKGGGNYACGTQLSPSTVGVQTITGLGFEPKVIFLASAQRTALTPAQGFSRITFGAGSFDRKNYNVWTGIDDSDGFHDQAATEHRAISMIRDTNFTGPFNPTSQAEARLEEVFNGGFTLNWHEVDGTSRYYSWFAMDGDVELDRWVYKHVSSVNATIETTYAPKGLIFFMNDMGVVSRTYPTTRGNDGGLGSADEDLNQSHVSFMTNTENPGGTGGNQINSRCHIPGEAFGSYEGRVTANSAPNFSRDRGALIEIDDVEEKPPIHLSRIKFRAWQDSEV